MKKNNAIAIADEQMKILKSKAKFESEVLLNKYIFDTSSLLHNSLEDLMSNISKLSSSNIVLGEELLQDVPLLNGMKNQISDYLNICNIVVEDIDCDGINEQEYIENIEYTIDELVNKDIEYINFNVSKKGKKTNNILGAIILIIAIFFLIKNLIKYVNILKETRFPSVKMMNISITPLIVRIKSLMKISLESIDLSKYTPSLIILDNILKIVISSLSAYVLASIIFNNNKKKVQDASYDDFKAFVDNNTCEGYQEHSEDIKVSENTLKRDIHTLMTDIDVAEGINCDIMDDFITPSKPFLRKVEDFKCESDTINEDIVFEHKESYDLIDKAIFDDVEFKGGVGDSITYLSNIGGFISPISGVVEKNNERKLYISDIEDEDVEITDKIERLVNIHKSEEEIIELFNKCYFFSMYPYMLHNSAPTTINNPYAPKIESIYSDGVKKYNKLISNFEKFIQNTCTKENIESGSNDDTLDAIAESIITEKTKLNSEIKSLSDKCVKDSLSTRYENDDMNILSYYIKDLGVRIVELDSVYAKELLSMVNEIISKRKLTDTYQSSDIYDDIKKMVKDVSNKKINISQIMNIFNKNNSVEDVYNFLLEYIEDNSTCKRISYMVYIYHNKEYKQKLTQQEKITELNEEYLSINNFWKRLNLILSDLQKERESINIFFDKVGNVSYEYNIIEEGGEKYRLYSRVCEDDCDKSYFDIDSDFSPKTKIDFSNINYWRKYFRMATLVGCAPMYWSTGLIILGAPILLPVIYTPIKVLKTKWGIIVIGLGICGIAVSPLTFYVNFENKAVSLIPNIAINSLKSSLKLIKSDLRNIKNKTKVSLIQSLESQLKEELMYINNQISFLERENTQLKLSSIHVPKILPSYSNQITIPNISNLNQINISSDKNGCSFKSNIDIQITDNRSKINSCLESIKGCSTEPSTYVAEVNNYLDVSSEVLMQYSTNLLMINNLKDSKFSLETKIFNLQKNNNGFSSDCSDFPDVVAIDENISEMESKIDMIEQNIDSVLAMTPVGILAPNSVNFGPSIKKFLLVNQIETDISDKLDMDVLCPIIDSMIISPEMLDNPKFLVDKVSSIKNVLSKIDKILGLLLIKDVIPKYEKLTISNIKFILFLTTTFCVDGAKHFGIPGYPQLPI